MSDETPHDDAITSPGISPGNNGKNGPSEDVIVDKNSAWYQPIELVNIFKIEPAILVVEHAPEKARNNCAYCGHQNEGLKLDGINCCWFCQRKPMMRTRRSVPAQIPVAVAPQIKS